VQPSCTARNLYTLFTLAYIVSVNINLQNNQSVMSLCDYMHFILDHLHFMLHTYAHCSRYQDFLQCTSINFRNFIVLNISYLLID
jgi:hypothetical protein